MTKITTVRSCTVRVPLDNPTSFSSRQVLAREFALVEVEADDGVKGIGFTYGGSTAGSIVTEAVRELLAPVLIGEDPFRVEGLWNEMYREALLQGRAGAVMRAISALDIALWDRNARAAGLPLYKLLGGFAVESVRGYASGGYYLDGKTPEMLGRELKGYVDLGFDAVKMKVGRLDRAGEEERIAAARAAIGDDVILMLDCNNGWRDVETALRYMTAFEPYDPYWIEEPFLPDDIASHAKLAERTPVPVATGEIEAGRWRFKELLEAAAAAILQPDAIACGGITEWRRIAALAAAHGVSVCPHAYHELHLHLAASTPNASFVEVFTDDQIVNFRNLITPQAELDGGRVLLPAAPGLGFDYVTDAVDEFAIQPWA
ncbi:MAG: mandelate racemase/muconate lactonizing enzyme family protein [Alphaproteobacteria bacterium]|jgi:L-alanine-DL-glutamate epimerase-like enolase superfamily enzyme|nr:mandelate racemase/muconate lactonizing enzyme family protein [Alphaproteobacteria bacterium]